MFSPPRFSIFTPSKFPATHLLSSTMEARNTKNTVKGTVCVTGASGYLASWLVKRLLLAGFHVRGTVRNPGDRQKLAHLLALEGAAERLELLRADLMEEGSFDEAVHGCEGVFHTASPVTGAKEDPKAEILDPAINGTLNVLRSCKKSAALRRVVLTSSTAAARVRDDIDPTVPIDESSWSSVHLCQKMEIWYALSKTLAERAAWEFASENGLDLVTVLPSFIVGPSLPAGLCSTVSDVLGLLRGQTDQFSWHGRMGYVHIDDVAACHILVYEARKARGRYLCSSRVMENYQLAELLAEKFPWLPIPRKFEKVGAERAFYELDTSKMENLGFKFKGVEEMFEDCVVDLKKKGHLV